MTRIKIIVLCSFLSVLVAFYLWSINNAYNKGYNQHALEVAQAATEIIVGSNTDILNAAQTVIEKEKDIKKDEVCSAIWNFNIAECLR